MYKTGNILFNFIPPPDLLFINYYYHMQEKYSTLHHLLNNIVGYLSNIPFDYLDTFIPSYCIIFIIAFITLLGFVSFAARRITVDSYMDTQTDLERRANDNTIPLNLSFIYVMSPTWNAPRPFLIDKNETAGIRIKSLFPDRTATYRIIDGRGGFVYNPGKVVVNSQGELLTNVNIYSFVAVDQLRGVQSGGLPVQKIRHAKSPYTVTVLRVLRDV